MRRVVFATLLLCAAPVLAEVTAADPPRQTVVFYNARTALRENKPQEVLKLWLLRNSLAHAGERSEVDEEFRSVVWAALGKLGLCQDGLPRDIKGGAGLWPLALHNWLVQSIARGPPPATTPPWDVFAASRQQRFISLNDVLSAEELRSVSFFRSNCILPRAVAVDFKGVPWLDLDDRLSVGLLMHQLLEASKETLVREKVMSLAVIDARLFDLDLALAALKQRNLRRESREAAQLARGVGASREAAAEVRQKVAQWPPDSKQAAFLRQSLQWKPSEWLSLSTERRLSLFAHARPLAPDPAARDALALAIIDGLITTKAGDELNAWIGFLDGTGSPSLRDAVTLGARGQRLLELEPASGFRERPVVALHRGVSYLEAGDRQEALRSFAYALQRADESREAEATTGLARRWLSFVLSRFETSQQVVDTLKVLVPKHEYNAVIEDLVWRAALRADRASFDRLAGSARRGGAFDARVALLDPLASGDPGKMATALRDRSKDEPHSVLRFVKQLIEHLEAEDGDVRLANVPTLKLLLGVLDPIAEGEGGTKNAQTRTAEELMARTQSILDGLRHLDLSEEGRSRAMSPSQETFAGSIRLAPADPLPWPFRMPEPEPPSAFVPLVLQPVEWRGAQGELVFGWRLSE